MDDIPEEFWQGIEQFNQQEFYACHDTLEAIWIHALPEDKNFYQGVLQIAVALHHLSNRNWRGAVILMGEGIHRLRSYVPTYAGIDVDDLIDQANSVLKHLQKTGVDQVDAIARQLFTPDSTSASYPEITLPTIQFAAT